MNIQEPFEETCVALLKKKGYTVSTMESCTGGMVAAALVNVSGASEVFAAGYTTYSDEAKHKILGVKKETLDTYTAVSPQVAEEMVRGEALVLKQDVAVSVTGIAGPNGGTDEKPVGLVYLGCRVKNMTKVKECHFTGNRMEVRSAAMKEALKFMIQCINESEQ